MLKVRETQSDTGAWAADNAGISTDLLRNGAITRIVATVEVTPSATLGGANQPDGLWRVIQNLSIMGGSKTYFTLPADDACMGGTLLHYLNRVDGFGLGTRLSTITAPQRTYTPVSFVLHAGSRPKANGHDNPFDATAFIPATKEGRLRAIWVTSGNDVMDDTVTISSATLRFTLWTIMGTDQELRQEMAQQGVQLPPGVAAMEPQWSAEVFSHSATASDYSAERNVPTGGWLKRIGIAEQDATADRSVRASDEGTAFAVKLSKAGVSIIKSFGDAYLLDQEAASVLEADDAAMDFGVTAAQGLFYLDLRPHASPEVPWGRDYGLNLMNVNTGDVKLGMTITTYAAGDDSLILYERAVPILQGQAII